MALAQRIPETPLFRLYGLSEGLPSLYVSEIALDRRGYLWMATSNGLVRYDGVAFKKWTIPNTRHSEKVALASSIGDLLIDSQDRIWFVANGAYVISPDRQSIRAYTQETSEWLTNDSIQEIAENNGVIWLASGDGLFKIDASGRGTKFVPPEGKTLPSQTVYAIAFDRNGRLWIGTHAGMASWDGKKLISHPLPPVRKGDASMHSIMWRVQPWKDGVLASSGTGVYSFSSTGAGKATAWSHKFSHPNVFVQAEQTAGETWATSLEGTWKINGEQAILASTWDEASNNQTPSLLGMEDGSLWTAAPGKGVAHLNPNWRMISVPFLKGDRHQSNSIAAARDGSFWIQGDHGLPEKIHMDGTVSQPFKHLKSKIGNIRRMIEALDGSLWAISSSSLWKISADGIKSWNSSSPEDPTPPNMLSHLQEGKNGEIFVSIGGLGLQRRNAQGKVIGMIDSSDHESINLSPEGDIWFADKDGIKRWTTGHSSGVVMPGLERVRNYYNSLGFVNRDDFWIAEVGILKRFQRRSGRWQRTEQVDTSDGLPLSPVSGLSIDPKGNPWVTTRDGLFSWNSASRRLERYGRSNGLPSQDFAYGANRINGAGVLALLTSDKNVVLVDTMAARIVPKPSPLVIDEIQVRQEGMWRTIDSSKAISPATREIRVQLRLLSYLDSAANKYRTRLEGYDSQWIEHQGIDPGERTFANLPPGSYLLRARATDAAGIEAKETSFGFEVLPFWWESRSARFAYAFCVLFAAYFSFRAYRSRARRKASLRKAEYEREVAREASLAKTRFLATLGHEVRTPMTGVLGMSELMLGTPLDATQRGYMTAIHGAGEHLVRLVNDALDLSRIESGKLELLEAPFNLHKLVNEITQLMAPLAQRKGLAFEVRVVDGVRAGQLGDASRVRQILLNLLGNAIKFTEAGRVWLDVTQPDEDCVRFEVGDTGPGLNEEQKSRLFRRFEQAEGAHTAARYGGSGLGLAICQELAALMQGTIAVDSTPGHGARFVVDLQLRAAVLADTGEQQSPIATTPSRAVLLVEDDSIVADVIVGLLQAQGHRVTHVAHGLAAMSEATLCTFDLALLDLDLPGIDGFALARHLRAQGFDAPMVALTARADAQAHDLALQAGCARFLRKPVTGAMLAQLIAELEERRALPA